jgi:hypothetical protein
MPRNLKGGIMIRPTIITVLASPALALCITACDGTSPMSPQEAAEAAPVTARVPTALKPLPFHGVTAGRLVSMVMAPPGRCPEYLPLLFTYEGAGNATHFGRFTVEGDECAYFDSSDPSTAASGVSEWTFTAANGDELYVSYDVTTGTLELPWLLWSAEIYATGGTGRFETAELVDVTWSGGVHLVTFETYSTLDGRIEFR